MFRIVCFVDDKELAPVMHALAGKAKGLEVVPVVNVEPSSAKNGKLVQRTEGKVLDLFAEYLNTHPGIVDAEYVQTFLTSIGRSTGSYSHTLYGALDAKLLKKGKPHPHKPNGYVYERVTP